MRKRSAREIAADEDRETLEKLLDNLQEQVDLLTIALAKLVETSIQ